VTVETPKLVLVPDDPEPEYDATLLSAAAALAAEQGLGEIIPTKVIMISEIIDSEGEIGRVAWVSSLTAVWDIKGLLHDFLDDIR